MWYIHYLFLIDRSGTLGALPEQNLFYELPSESTAAGSQYPLPSNQLGNYK